MPKQNWSKNLDRTGMPMHPNTRTALQKVLKGNKHKLGKKQSEETKMKIRKWALENKEKMREAGIKGYLIQDRTKKPTSIEKAVYEKLLEMGIIFERQYVVNGKFIVDAYLPEFNLIIEVDGKYWHGLDSVMKKDKAENAYLKKCGYRVVRIPEDQVVSFSMSSLLGNLRQERRVI